VTAKSEAESGEPARAPSRTPPPLPAPDFEPETHAVVVTTKPDVRDGESMSTLVPLTPPPDDVERTDAGEEGSPMVVLVEAPAIVEEVRTGRTSSRPPPPPPAADASPQTPSDPPSRPRAVTPAPPLRLPADTVPIATKREGSAPPPAPPAEETPPPREPKS
jgi:hypothetical protein